MGREWGYAVKGVPGWLVFGMAAVWIVPLCVLHLTSYPLLPYWNSHLLYGVLLGVAVLGMFGMNLLDLATGFWGRTRWWFRVLALCGGYVLMMACDLAVLLILDSARVLHYYEGDPEGSAGMLILPSVVLWLGAGAVSSFLIFVISRFRKPRT